MSVRACVRNSTRGREGDRGPPWCAMGNEVPRAPKKKCGRQIDVRTPKRREKNISAGAKKGAGEKKKNIIRAGAKKGGR